MSLRKNFIHFLISILLLSSLIFIIKTINFKNNKDSNKIRDLLLDNAKTYLCNIAGSRLTAKYEGGFDEERGDAEENLNKDQQSIIDSIRDFNYRNIKPYLKKVIIFIIISVFILIFIFIWIICGFCSVLNCGLFSKVDDPNETKQLKLYLISAGFSLLIIIFSIAILSLSNPFYSRLNGVFCSIFTFLNHLNDGLSPQYPPHANEWLGLSGTAIKFKESQQELEKIDFISIDNLYNEINDKCSLPENNCICDTDELYADYNSFTLLIKFVFTKFRLPDKIANILKSKNIIDDTIINTGEKIYNFLYNYGNKNIRNIFMAIFILTSIIGILSLIFLSLYYFLKKEQFRIIYITIWNISMLLMILSVAFSSSFGIFGYVSKDFVQIVHYTLSKNNIESDNPIIFPRGNYFFSNIIDRCTNGDGHLLDFLGEKFSELNTSIQNDFQNSLNILYNNTCMNETRDAIIELYKAFSNATNQVLTIYEDLINIKCNFAKNDKNIILNEIKSVGSRAFVIAGFQFLVVIFMGISILSGILLVHKYNYKKQFYKLNDTDNSKNHLNNNIEKLNN